MGVYAAWRVIEGSFRNTREGAKLALTWGEDWYLPRKLQEFMLSGGFEEERIRMEECDIWLKVKDLKRWATILWSFLGARDDGWKVEDEEKWEEVVEMLVGDLEGSSECKRSEDGTLC